MTRVMLIVADSDDQARRMVDRTEFREADVVVRLNPELSGAHTLKDRFGDFSEQVKVVTA